MSSASAGPTATTVLLSVNGSSAARLSEPAGKTATVSAAATLKFGDRLAIFAQRSSESKVRVVAQCTKTPCTHGWRETVAQTVSFQAAVVHTVSGALKLLAKSRIATVTWRAAVAPPAPPPPPPPPTAQPGHYEGTTSQNEKWAFDVTADGKGVTNLTTGQINKSCSPAVVYVYGGNLHYGSTVYPIAADGSFTIAASYPTTLGPSAAVEKATISGRIASGIASGTFVIQDDATGLSCSSGNQTWQATRTG